MGTYISIYSNKKNRVFGTNSLKAKAHHELSHINEVFPGLRGQFRASCQEFYKAAGQ